MRICSVSVDLDPISCYRRIHGLPAESGPDPVYAHALPRFLDLFDELGVRGTFFVIGQDLAEPAHAALLREAVERGHELANHTLEHPYNLPQLSPDECRRQIEGCHQALAAIGVDCVGFRAPGYNIDPRTLHVLESLGYHYDSSIFPCPPYYLAKAAVMTAIRLRGGRSGSAMVQARTQLAPTRPYFPRRDAAHRPARAEHHAAPLVELPMCVLPAVRVPLIGTSLIMAGPRASAALVALAARHHREFLNLELHGIDLIDPEHDGIGDDLRRRQPDLRHGLEHKLATFRAAFSQAARRGYALETCRTAAEELSHLRRPRAPRAQAASSSSQSAAAAAGSR